MYIFVNIYCFIYFFLSKEEMSKSSIVVNKFHLQFGRKTRVQYFVNKKMTLLKNKISGNQEKTISETLYSYTQPEIDTLWVEQPSIY